MASIAPRKIAIIQSSTRSVRIGPSVTQIVQNLITASPSSAAAELTVIDVAEFKLPVFDEKVIPAMVPKYAQFEHEHSKKWSAAIAPFDGYIWISPEYNIGVPGGVKNAIDYLYNEWVGKPIAIITYGIHGGNTASFNLKRTFEGMKLRVVPTRPRLAFVGGAWGADTQGALFGNLGEESKKAWVEDKTIGEAFEELVELLNDPEKKGSEVDFKTEI